MLKGIEKPSEESKTYWISTFQNIFAQEEESAQDGCFNYFLTKLFKSLLWNAYATSYYSYRVVSPVLYPIVREMLKVYNIPSPNYAKYNRAMGMLICCSREAKRRYGDGAVLAIMFLDRLINDLYREIGIYEADAMERNGDV